MSNSNINNGKRHVRDRAYYGGTPNQKKRIKFILPEEEPKMNKKYNFKYNIESIITIILIATGWTGGNEGMKILAMIFAFLSGWSYWKMED